MCADQGIYQTRNGVARLLGLPVAKIRRAGLRRLEYLRQQLLPRRGTSGGHHVAGSRQAVRLQFSREDEFGWDNYGPALLSDLRGGCRCQRQARRVTSTGRWVHTAAGLDTTSQLALGPQPPFNVGGGKPPGARKRGLFSVHLSQTDMYDVPNRRIVNHRVAGAGYLRTGALRAPMDPSTFFALEGTMDELAYAARLDPYEFRKRNISHKRWLGVLEAATTRRSGRRASRRPTCRTPESSPGAASDSARTTCRRTRGIASRMRRPSWTSK